MKFFFVGLVLKKYLQPSKLLRAIVVNTQREFLKYIVLELRTFVLKMFSILERNNEKRKVKLS